MKSSPGLSVSTGTATVGGDILPSVQYDIHCPLMGGPDYKFNYLSGSCRERVKAFSCRDRGCQNFKSGKPKPRVHKADTVPDRGTLAKVEFKLTFTGDDARVIMGFVDLSHKNGGNPSEDIATVIELFMDGRMRVIG
jgi:hypothetical protein